MNAILAGGDGYGSDDSSEYDRHHTALHSTVVAWDVCTLLYLLLKAAHRVLREGVRQAKHSPPRGKGPIRTHAKHGLRGVLLLSEELLCGVLLTGKGPVVEVPVHH
jgi:hypothetical protein